MYCVLGKRKKSIDGNNPPDFTGMYILCCNLSLVFNKPL